MSAFAQVLKHLIDAERILDTRIERIETQLAGLNAKLAVMQRSLDAMRAKLATKDGWEDVQVLTDEDVVSAGAAPRGAGIVGVSKTEVQFNSDPVAALPTTEELFAGLENIIR